MSSSSTMEEGFPLCCRSLVGREVKGIGESNSKGDFLVSSPSLILDSEKTKDMSVGGSDEVEIHAQKNKRDEKVLERANGKAKRQKGDNVGMVGEKVRKGREGKVCQLLFLVTSGFLSRSACTLLGFKLAIQSRG